MERCHTEEPLTFSGKSLGQFEPPEIECAYRCWWLIRFGDFEIQHLQDYRDCFCNVDSAQGNKPKHKPACQHQTCQQSANKETARISHKNSSWMTIENKKTGHRPSSDKSERGKSRLSC